MGSAAEAVPKHWRHTFNCSESKNLVEIKCKRVFGFWQFILPPPKVWHVVDLSSESLVVVTGLLIK